MLKHLFCCIILSTVVSAANAVSATVDYVIDGDTFNATVNIDKDINIKARIRILNIDSPELKGDCDTEINLAKQSKERLIQLLPKGSVIELSDLKDDKYLGRINAIVKNSDGLDVSKTLIDEKLAVPYSGGKRISWCD